MIHLTFRNTTSMAMGVCWKSRDRTLLAERRIAKHDIPGRNGYYEVDQGAYDNRTITGTIAFLGNDYDFPTLRTKARAVAQWLTGSGQLIFSDEPDKAYRARVIGNVPLEQLARVGSCSVSFDCSPFAESLDYRQVNTEITANNAEIPVSVYGTAETPCIITIKNIGASNIGGIIIRRKAAI